MKKKLSVIAILLCAVLFVSCGTVDMWQGIDGDTRVYTLENDGSVSVTVNKDGTCAYSDEIQAWTDATDLIDGCAAEYRLNAVYYGTYKLKGGCLCISLKNEEYRKFDIRGDVAAFKTEYIAHNPEKEALFGETGLSSGVAEWSELYLECKILTDTLRETKSKITLDDGTVTLTTYRYAIDGRILRIIESVNGSVCDEINYEYNGDGKPLKIAKARNGSTYEEIRYTYNEDDSYTVTDIENGYTVEHLEYSAENTLLRTKKYKKYELCDNEGMTSGGVGIDFYCEYDVDGNATKYIKYEPSTNKPVNEYLKKDDGSFSYISYEYANDGAYEYVIENEKNFDCNDILLSGSEHINGELTKIMTYFHVSGNEYEETVRDADKHIINKTKITVLAEDYKPKQ